MGWSPEQVALAAAQGLAHAEAALALEQAVHGLDVLDELGLHPLLAEGLRTAGFGVHREQRYPMDRGRRRRSEGLRCDLVLTPAGRPLAEVGQQDLFGGETAPMVAWSEALWIEVKTIAQFRCGKPNFHYEQALKRPVFSDVDKLAEDPGIVHAAVLVVLFTADPQVAAHDLGVWWALATAHGLHLEPPCVVHVPILDRIGNACVTVALMPLARASVLDAIP